MQSSRNEWSPSCFVSRFDLSLFFLIFILKCQYTGLELWGHGSVKATQDLVRRPTLLILFFFQLEIIFFFRFTVFSCLIQYILPLIVISLLYTKIYKFLLTRRFQSSPICQKQRRTNCILLSTSLIFLIRYIVRHSGLLDI